MNAVFEGVDESPATWYVVLLGIAAELALYFAVAELSAIWAAVWLAAVIGLPVAWFGTRYRLEVGGGGLVLTRRWAWLLPVRRRRFYLDSHPVVSESIWADEFDDDPGAGGVFLTTAEIGEDSSDVFGPIWGDAAMEQLRDDVHEAILQARGEVRGRPLNLSGQTAADFEVLEFSPSGVPRSVRNRTGVRVPGIEIPVGSTFQLNRDDWVDPARPDQLRNIVVADATPLPCGLEVAAGGELRFSSLEPSHVTVVSGLPADVDVAGLKLRGEQITFDTARRFRPIHFELAAAARFGETLLPCGTRVDRSWSLDGTWAAELGGPLSLADVELIAKDTVHFDANWRVVSIWVDRTGVLVHNVALTSRFAALPVERTGRVSLRKCRSLGYLE